MSSFLRVPHQTHPVSHPTLCVGGVGALGTGSLSPRLHVCRVVRGVPADQRAEIPPPVGRDWSHHPGSGHTCDDGSRDIPEEPPRNGRPERNREETRVEGMELTYKYVVRKHPRRDSIRSTTRVVPSVLTSRDVYSMSAYERPFGGTFSVDTPRTSTGGRDPRVYPSRHFPVVRPVGKTFLGSCTPSSV